MYGEETPYYGVFSGILVFTSEVSNSYTFRCTLIFHIYSSTKTSLCNKSDRISQSAFEARAIPCAILFIALEAKLTLSYTLLIAASWTKRALPVTVIFSHLKHCSHFPLHSFLLQLVHALQLSLQSNFPHLKQHRHFP